MKRVEEKFLRHPNPLLKPVIRSGVQLPSSMRGNVNALMLATAFVIASMWLMFQNSETQHNISPAAINAAIGEHNTTATKIAAYGYGKPVEELVVTAPRLVERAVTFERPEQNIKLSKPVAPAAFWQSPS